MHIDSCKFGRIVVDGVVYDRDVLIASGKVASNWRREQGHSLCVADMESVISAGPSVVVIGCGAYGVMKVPGETVEALSELGIRVEALKTGEAVERFNELMETGADAAAGLHLTC